MLRLIGLFVWKVEPSVYYVRMTKPSLDSSDHASYSIDVLITSECEWLGSASEGVFHFRHSLGPPEKFVELLFQHESEGQNFGRVVMHVVGELRHAQHAKMGSSVSGVDYMEYMSQAGKQCPPDRLSSFTFVLFHFPGSKA